MESVWPDWVIYWTSGNFSMPLATIILPKSLTFSGNTCKVVKIFHFSREIIFIDIWQLFTGHTGCMEFSVDVSFGTNLNRLVRPQFFRQNVDEVLLLRLEPYPRLPHERRIRMDGTEFRSTTNQIDGLLKFALSDQDLKIIGTVQNGFTIFLMGNSRPRFPLWNRLFKMYWM